MTLKFENNQTSLRMIDVSRNQITSLMKVDEVLSKVFKYKINQNEVLYVCVA